MDRHIPGPTTSTGRWDELRSVSLDAAVQAQVTPSPAPGAVSYLSTSARGATITVVAQNCHCYVAVHAPTAPVGPSPAPDAAVCPCAADGLACAMYVAVRSALDSAVAQCIAGTCPRTRDCVVVTGHAYGGTVAGVLGAALRARVVSFAAGPALVPGCTVDTARWVRYVAAAAAPSPDATGLVADVRTAGVAGRAHYGLPLLLPPGAPTAVPFAHGSSPAWAYAAAAFAPAPPGYRELLQRAHPLPQVAPGGERCALPQGCSSGQCRAAVSGGWQCLQSLGGRCIRAADCASGHCLYGFCRSCTATADCPAGHTCGRYGTCDVVKALVGQPCAGDGQCLTGVCAGGSCRQCRDVAQCGPGEDYCDPQGHCRCRAALGGACTLDVECRSGACIDDACRECRDHADCGAGTVCPQHMWRCVDPFAVGEACLEDAECGTGVCEIFECRACRRTEDCPAGHACKNWRCEALRRVGESCRADADCASGACDLFFCRECKGIRQGCSNNDFCSFWTCEAPRAEWAICSQGHECASGLCEAFQCRDCTGQSTGCTGRQFCLAWQCLEPYANGIPCTRDYMCDSGFCEVCPAMLHRDVPAIIRCFVVAGPRGAFEWGPRPPSPPSMASSAFTMGPTDGITACWVLWEVQLGVFRNFLFSYGHWPHFPEVRMFVGNPHIPPSLRAPPPPLSRCGCWGRELH